MQGLAASATNLGRSSAREGLFTAKRICDPSFKGARARGGLTWPKTATPVAEREKSWSTVMPVAEQVRSMGKTAEPVTPKDKWSLPAAVAKALAMQRRCRTRNRIKKPPPRTAFSSGT